jgi:hypothetical protein
MQRARNPTGNSFNGSAVFSRGITVIQGRVRLCGKFSSDDRRASRFWIAPCYEMICELCFSQCKSLASVAFDADTTVSRFDGHAFQWSGLTSIHIPSSVEVIHEYCFSRCKSLASVTHDPGSKLHPTLRDLLAGCALSPDCHMIPDLVPARSGSFQ